ncbi:DUF4139 domain-containing protein [Roseovarius aquimarinus]|uniref:Mucoidy inhibitor MuiA family protein n=1 Tax=Roseovarius aquimarinus TaxID=1229156 RepID=A0ABW7I7E1_9RHOB
MRATVPFLCLVIAMPLGAAAEDIALTSRVAAVTLYPQGARVVREVPFDVPAGQHDLVLVDLPQDTDLATLRAEVSGAEMGSVTTRRTAQPPRSETQSAAIEAAREEVERREDALRAARADIARLRLAVDAAEAQTAFLGQLGQGEGIAAQDVATLREMAEMIGQQTLAAREAAHDAARAAEIAERGLEDLEEALAEARQALAALVPEEEDRAMLAVTITAAEPSTGTLAVTYQTWNAGWAPVYDMSLARETGLLTIERGAYVRQQTGENWQDVALSLSTQRPSGQTRPSEIGPLLRRIGPPEPQLRKEALGAAMDSMAMSEAAPSWQDAPIVETASAEFDGLSVSYDYAPPVSVASGADALRIALGTLETEATIEARAVPLYDSNAFLMAEFTNDTGELILPGETHFYLGESYVGQTMGDLIPAGAKSEASFGPIDGLTLMRTVLDREEGGSGLIRKSNDLDETARIEIENLTAEAWPVRLLDRVPYSEQEDLQIDWQAEPRPDEVDVEDQTGVLAWDFEMAPGETRRLRIDYSMQWPEEQELR